jgi:hypothetical protein
MSSGRIVADSETVRRWAASNTERVRSSIIAHRLPLSSVPGLGNGLFKFLLLRSSENNAPQVQTEMAGITIFTESVALHQPAPADVLLQSFGMLSVRTADS